MNTLKAIELYTLNVQSLHELYLNTAVQKYLASHDGTLVSYLPSLCLYISDKTRSLQLPTLKIYILPTFKSFGVKNKLIYGKTLRIEPEHMKYSIKTPKLNVLLFILLSPREVQLLVQDHTAGNWERRHEGSILEFL